MATVLDLGVLEFFTPVFSLGLVIAVTYAILDKFKLLGENKVPKLFISFCVGMLFIFSADAVRFINFVSPWFVVFLVLLMFLLSAFLFMGVRDSELQKAVEDPRVYWPVLVIGIILFLVALTQIFGDKLPGSDPDDESRVTVGLNAIVHPRVLGAIVVLLIASVAIKFISENVVKPEG
ncbi:hypothetical protein CL617_00895 [archaeon]|nr:hypothetical protein [archaeon]|tara:strand:- start:2153 stop:2686 length:534 start_codon:yes stop_codon:yes gene_type:complete